MPPVICRATRTTTSAYADAYPQPLSPMSGTTSAYTHFGGSSNRFNNSEQPGGTGQGGVDKKLTLCRYAYGDTLCQG